MDASTTSGAGAASPPRCCLAHPLFTSLGEPLFRRAEADGEPVMVIALGERDAALPINALQREFGITPDSPDGQMLLRIAESLDFVSALRLGDALPSEILTGEASWAPDPVHFQIAATQLRLQLVDWLNAGSGGARRDLDAQSLLQVEDDPMLRQQIQEALTRAAVTLGLAAAADVVSRLEGLGRELAYIEALRDRLLRRVRVMTEKIEGLSRQLRSNAGRIETLSQVRRLSAIALRQIATHFDELDAQTGEVMSALRNADSQTVFIRSNRDWLYRSHRAWEPTLALWEAGGTEFDHETLSLLTRTYQFLAPRFMPVTEWISATDPRRAKVKPMRRMVW